MSTNIAPEYLALIERFPLRPIRSERELKRAAKVVDGLLDRKRSKEEDSYLNVLSLLIEQYEDERHSIEPVSAKDILAYSIEASGKPARTIALESGVQISTMSELLSGNREINLNHIRKLAPYFGVEPGVFISDDSMKPGSSAGTRSSAAHGPPLQ